MLPSFPDIFIYPIHQEPVYSQYKRIGNKCQQYVTMPAGGFGAYHGVYPGSGLHKHQQGEERHYKGANDHSRRILLFRVFAPVGTYLPQVQDGEYNTGGY